MLQVRGCTGQQLNNNFRKYEQLNCCWNWSSNLKTPNKQKPRTTCLHRWILPNIHRRVNIYPSEIIQKIAEEGTLLNSFSEATITVIPKPEKDSTKKENYKSISLINIDAKTLNKTQANWLQQYNKSYYIMINKIK